jgi:carbonic anhydrase
MPMVFMGTMNRRTLLLGFGIVGATALSGGGTVYALNTLGLAPRASAPDALAPAKPAEHGTSKPSEQIAHWSYEGATGPDRWGELDPANAMCTQGGAQSPIDLANAMRVAALPGLQLDYGSTRVKVTNNGHTFQVNVDKGSSFKVDGKRFDLLQFHFHTPSEHTIDGQTFPLEVHLVHQAADKSLAVIGVMLAEGGSSPNAVLGKFWERLPRSPGEADSGVSIEVKDLLPRVIDEYYTYSGSLTTPPCAETVRWIVLKQPVQVSRAQVATFRSVFPNNARPAMPLGARFLLSS